jgi:hypothetical protein
MPETLFLYLSQRKTKTNKKKTKTKKQTILISQHAKKIAKLRNFNWLRDLRIDEFNCILAPEAF